MPGPISGALKIYHLPVGQGDATLIAGPDGTTLLVDAGPNSKAGNQLPGSQLNWFVATHNDSDHIGGIKWVALGKDGAPGEKGKDDDGNGLIDWTVGICGEPAPDPGELNAAGSDDHFPTSGIIYNGDQPTCGSKESKTFQRFYNIIQAKPERVTKLSTFADLQKAFQQPLNLGSGAKARVVVANGYIFNEPGRVAGVNTQNERSIGLYLEYGSFDYLVSGDLTGQKFGAGDEDAKMEEALGRALLTSADSPPGDPIDVFKVNHHGSNSASNASFLLLIKPETAIISVGKNTYGHPHPEALKRLTASGAKILTTLNGLILITTDGSAIKVEEKGL